VHHDVEVALAQRPQLAKRGVLRRSVAC